ncbi:hypothetical protein ABZ517_23275 [Streptomyces scabiei]|uniref:hypothetical protein n=1 Tax=Streptomyces scabiei TaxID=1930 RepID=UPI0033E0CAF6
MTYSIAPEFDSSSELSLLPLLRRPDAPKPPLPVKDLRGARTALWENVKSGLDDAAANVITYGAADPHHLMTIVGTKGDTNLLVPKPVAGGKLWMIGIHQRYTDLGVLPDIVNQRWAHRLLTAMDVDQPTTPAYSYDTLNLEDGTGRERPLAILTVRMADRKALAEAVTESMRQTHESQGGHNDYTDSVLQQGIKEPMTLFVMRVVFDDESEETYLVTGDGNSRLVSMWLARTGGDIYEAAAACVAAVIGSVDRKAPRTPTDLRGDRRQVESMAARISRGLGEQTLTEATRREGHTFTFPATIVVGAELDDGSPMDDLVVARDDLLANLHIRVTPWLDDAQNTQGMQRVYRHALAKSIVSAEEHKILTGTADPGQMHNLLGLPQHRLWATALHQHVILADRATPMIELLRQEFGIKRADRQLIGKRIGAMVLSAYRSSSTLDHALRTFDNGGTITDTVWKQNWTLTQGSNPIEVLDDILERALAEDQGAVAELTVLGGTAAILDTYITRDRGSKLGVKAENGKAPYRAVPTVLLDRLASTKGGLRMLHSIARAHVAARKEIVPKAFHTVDREIDGVAYRDGEPVIDAAGAQATLQHEWDLVWRADPERAETTIATTKKALRDAGKSGGSLPVPDHVKEQRALDQALTNATKAAQKLAVMATTDGRGAEVFGSYEAVTQLRGRLKGLDDLVVAYGPKPPVPAMADATELLVNPGEDGDEE